jgi:hypothetical protein
MLLINENSDPDDGTAGGQDILAMPIIVNGGSPLWARE